MGTEVLLLFGATTIVVFVVVVLVEGARRPGYDPTYHTGSELELGPGGWIMRGAFLLAGAGMLAFAVGVFKALDSSVGAILLGASGLGSVIAGVFPPDPVRGYPPGASTRPPLEGLSVRARVHDATGPLMFLSLVGACLALTGRLSSPWDAYTIMTAVVGFGMLIWTFVAYKRDASNLGLVQRVFIAVFYAWIVAIGIHLATLPAA